MNNPTARINIGNIYHNISEIKNKVGHSKIMAVIKANAYGHGSIKLAQMMDTNDNVDAFAVARFHEALELHHNNIKKPILLLAGVLSKEQLELCAEYGIWIAIFDETQLKLISATPLSKPLAIWLKFNTGMNRLGFNQSEIPTILEYLKQFIISQKIQINCVIMSHLSCSDDLHNQFTQVQINNFQEIVKQITSSNINLNFMTSLASSAGIFGWPDSYGDWVRPGLSLYGASAMLEKTRSQLNLRPSMTLMAKIISVKSIRKGETVGYGATWQASTDTHIATIACGYGDGYPRQVKNAYVSVNNTLCSIIGRISMDTIVIDCHDLIQNGHDIKIGDEVELWGEHINIDDLAAKCNTISYELFTRIGSRVEKYYV